VTLNTTNVIYRNPGRYDQLFGDDDGPARTVMELVDTHGPAPAMLWYGKALDHAGRAGDLEAAEWVAARSTLIAVNRGDYRQVMHDAATPWPSPPWPAEVYPRQCARGVDRRAVGLSSHLVIEPMSNAFRVTCEAAATV